MCEAAQEKKVLAMYDVRGIQKYIFRTAKVKDAIGASRIVENIIPDALQAAVEELQKTSQEEQKLKVELQWCGEDGPFPYTENGQDIQVLFVGGGNAFVMYRDKKLCLKVNRLMARYTLEHTYSLQLAAAIVEKSNNYSEDYRRLFARMNETKADMILSKPLGTIPIMEMEIKTGYPLVSKEGSTETRLKKESGTEKQKKIQEDDEKKFDSYVTKKGTDSTIAVVHIDGNSMGQRIRQAVEKIENYTEAVNRMRSISYYINASYKKVFEEMKEFFNTGGRKLKGLQKKESPYIVREILVAGDDITFVCNGKAALAAVEYYCRRITGFTMNGEKDAESIQKYGFSVCAGVAYIGSHFPFSTGYEVAEACCESAKKRAKKEENMDGERVGNFVDFHICKNIHAQNFERMRKREYVTSNGEELLIRPYYIPTDTEGALGKMSEAHFSFQKLKDAVKFFQDIENIPKSFVKELRNTYPLGEGQMNLLYSFLESRGRKMPDGKDEMYWSEKGVKIAKWYDALEIQDYFADLKDIEGEDV